MTESAKTTEELFGLLGALRDQRITDEQLKRLDCLITGNKEYLSYYIDYVQLCTNLRKYGSTYRSENANESEYLLSEVIEKELELQSQSALKDKLVLIDSQKDKIQKSAETALQKFLEEERNKEKALLIDPRKIRNRNFFLIACSLLICLLITDEIFNLRQYVKSAFTPKPVAYVSNASNLECNYNASGVIGMDDRLFAGNYSLTEGLIEITYNSGAKVIIESPSEFALNNDNLMFLKNGALSALSPLEGGGFTVDTPNASFEDVSTQFGVKVTKRGKSEMQVIKGKVIAYVGVSSQKQRVSQTVETGQARLIEPDSLVIKEIPYDPNEYALSWDDALYIVRTTGDVRLNKTDLQFLRHNDYEDAGRIQLVLEQKNVTLQKDVTTHITSPGRFESGKYLTYDIKTIPAGVKADCYLIHLGRITSKIIPGDTIKLTGRIRFPRPIIGVLVETNELAESDEQFARADIIYYMAKSEVRGAGDKSKARVNDVISISDDRRTLDVVFLFNTLDQIRVLTEAPANVK